MQGSLTFISIDGLSMNTTFHSGQNRMIDEQIIIMNADRTENNKRNIVKTLHLPLSAFMHFSKFQ